MKHTIKLAVLTALAGSAALAVGCSSDSNNPTPGDIGGGGSGGQGGSAGSGTGGGTAGKGGSGTGGEGTGGAATGGAGGEGGGATGGGGNLDGGSGGAGDGGSSGSCTLGTQATPCYTCDQGAKPTTDDQWLNQCTANSCVKFDNTVLPNPIPQVP